MVASACTQVAGYEAKVVDKMASSLGNILDTIINNEVKSVMK